MHGHVTKFFFLYSQLHLIGLWLIEITGNGFILQHPYKIIAHYDNYQNSYHNDLLSYMGIKYSQPTHFLQSPN